ncbi:collagen alpha-1(III) chain-like [Odocoileus virginianus]|uniref:Collagen alpha-1(III) chain-like n=1 Tax=Odocoileus virginianus TaxID=9874 RepID=A0ABM4J3U8_ODOVR
MRPLEGWSRPHVDGFRPFPLKAARVPPPLAHLLLDPELFWQEGGSLQASARGASSGPLSFRSRPGRAFLNSSPSPSPRAPRPPREASAGFSHASGPCPGSPGVRGSSVSVGTGSERDAGGFRGTVGGANHTPERPTVGTQGGARLGPVICDGSASCGAPTSVFTRPPSDGEAECGDRGLRTSLQQTLGNGRFESSALSRERHRWAPVSRPQSVLAAWNQDPFLGKLPDYCWRLKDVGPSDEPPRSFPGLAPAGPPLCPPGRGHLGTGPGDCRLSSEVARCPRHLLSQATPLISPPFWDVQACHPRREQGAHIPPGESEGPGLGPCPTTSVQPRASQGAAQSMYLEELNERMNKWPRLGGQAEGPGSRPAEELTGAVAATPAPISKRQPSEWAPDLSLPPRLAQTPLPRWEAPSSLFSLPVPGAPGRIPAGCIHEGHGRVCGATLGRGHVGRSAGGRLGLRWTPAPLMLVRTPLSCSVSTAGFYSRWCPASGGDPASLSARPSPADAAHQGPSADRAAPDDKGDGSSVPGKGNVMCGSGLEEGLGLAGMLAVLAQRPGSGTGGSRPLGAVEKDRVSLPSGERAASTPALWPLAEASGAQLGRRPFTEETTVSRSPVAPRARRALPAGLGCIRPEVPPLTTWLCSAKTGAVLREAGPRAAFQGGWGDGAPRPSCAGRCSPLAGLSRACPDARAELVPSDGPRAAGLPTEGLRPHVDRAAVARPEGGRAARRGDSGLTWTELQWRGPRAAGLPAEATQASRGQSCSGEARGRPGCPPRGLWPHLDRAAVARPEGGRAAHRGDTGLTWTELQWRGPRAAGLPAEGLRPHVDRAAVARPEGGRAARRGAQASRGQSCSGEARGRPGCPPRGLRPHVDRAAVARPEGGRAARRGGSGLTWTELQWRGPRAAGLPAEGTQASRGQSCSGECQPQHLPGGRGVSARLSPFGGRGPGGLQPCTPPVRSLGPPPGAPRIGSLGVHQPNLGALRVERGSEQT